MFKNNRDLKYQQNKMRDLNTQKVTRLEVIDCTRRVYVNWNSDNVVSVQLQDDGRTLKVFINNKNKKETNKKAKLL